MKTAYLAYETACWYWQNAPQGPTTLACASTRRILADCACNQGQVLDAVEGTWLASRELAVAVDKRGVKDTSQVKFRSCAAKLPPRAYVQLARNVFVASPELSFFQAAEIMSLPQAVAYGCALCGTYVLDAVDGLKPLPRAALTSKEKLAAFLDKCQGVRGVKNARRALQYVLERSASPRETQVALLLTLPLALGGYALPAPQLNFRVMVPPELRVLTQRRDFYVDFFWEEAGVAGEYDSDAFHLESRERFMDQTKRTALESMGYVTFGITNLQVSSLVSMDATAEELRKRLEARKYSRFPANYEEKKRWLRGELGLPC